MTASPTDPVVEARRREIATEHLLFQTIAFLARRHPELLDELEAGIGHLWDHGDTESRDDEAVRTIARRFVASLRGEG